METAPTTASEPEAPSTPQGEILDPEYDYAAGTPAAEPAKTPEELDKLTQEDWHQYNVRNAECMRGLGKAAAKVAEKVKLSVVAYVAKFYPDTLGGRPSTARLASARLAGAYPTKRAYLEFLRLPDRTFRDWRAWSKGLLEAPPVDTTESTRTPKVAADVNVTDPDTEPQETDQEAAEKFFTKEVKRELLAAVQTRLVLKATLQMAVDAFNKEYAATEGMCTVDVHFLPHVTTKPDTTDELDKLNKAAPPSAAVETFAKLPATTPHYTVRFNEVNNEYQILTRTGKVYDVRKSKEKADAYCAKENQKRQALDQERRQQELVTA